MSDPVFVGATKALRIISTSEAKTFRRCPRKHHYSYRLRRRPLARASALRFGTLWHVGLEVWWQTVDLDRAILAMRASDREIDPYELAKAEALLIGYHFYWDSESIDVLAVEREFAIDLVNPITGKKSRTFSVGGKADGIVFQPGVGHLIVEHKTTSESVVAGGDYWRKLRMDAQVSTYIAAGKALGFDIVGCLYDVVSKPTLEPRMATPMESRQYTQKRDKACPECKKKSAGPAPHVVDGLVCDGGRIVTDPGGRLYANQREADETPEEYRSRLVEDIKLDPSGYYARGHVVRLDGEADDAAFDLWATARAIREAELAERYPRHVEACFDFHRACPYFRVCCGEASIDDDGLFRTAKRSHEELTGKEASDGSTQAA